MLTLARKLPEALRRFIGGMANNEGVLVGSDLRPEEPREAGP
jgi:hypothetical protein